jgi:tRNA G26 N,N-dimethylase Trm1
MSNREGNQQRIMEMHEADMPPSVIAAYMTNWNVPMTTPDVQGIINTFEPMGTHAVKKSDVAQAIKTHQRIEEINKASPIFEEDDDSDLMYTDVNEEDAE